MTGRQWATYATLWAGATLLAVVLAWYGVQNVLRTTVFDRPGLVPPVGAPGHAAGAPPASPGFAPTPSASSPTPQHGSHSPAPSHTATTSATPPNVSSYSTRHGRAALAITANDVRIVSATPNPDSQVTITRNPFWLRVDFTNGPHTSSIIASWYEHAPTVQVFEQ